MDIARDMHTPARRGLWHAYKDTSLQVLAAMVAGILLGWLAPQAAVAMKPFGGRVPAAHPHGHRPGHLPDRGHGRRRRRGTSSAWAESVGRPCSTSRR